MRRFVLILGVVLLVGAGTWWSRSTFAERGPVVPPAPAKTQRVNTGAASPDRIVRADDFGILTPEILASEFPIVAPLNRPDSTIQRDLETVAHVLDAWRSNFPRDGNPMGENADITAALGGENSLGLVLIPRRHPAINAAGELCDRWGTPFRFHQISGQHMEVRSAGPDRKFATADDANWNPAP